MQNRITMISGAPLQWAATAHPFYGAAAIS
jgi:hypothetical protein